MSHRTRQLMTTIILVTVLGVGLVILPGCKKKTQPAAPTAIKQAVTAAVEQTVCPVSGDPIDKKVSIDYQGRKVYFCCTACIAPFNADPNKYMDKLPQFKK
jgi:YHS domain-containing protein